MLQQEQEQDAHAVSRLTPQDSSDSITNPRVEAYLDSVSPVIASGLDEAHNREARAEMRTHIESLVEAYVELGDSHEQAVEHALEQFGKSHTIRREWGRAYPVQGSVKRSVLTALIFNAMACVTAGTVIPIGIRFANDLGWRAA